MDEFLKDIPNASDKETQGDVFDQNLNTAPEKDVAVITERDNREAKRAKKALQAEREANIALNARLQTMTEFQRFSEATPDNVDEKLLQLYGNDEKGKLAARITQDLLDKTREQAAQSALESFQSQQQEEQAEVAESQRELDTMLEDIEDEFPNVDLTSDSPSARKLRQGFYAALEKVSPKNEDGMVKEYADPIATFEYFQSTQTPETNRSKDLAARGMVRSGQSGDSKLEQTVQERFLKDAGII